MCHLILLMPVLGLPLFWLLPLGYALPSYVVIALISAFLYWLIRGAMRKPPQDGFQSLIGTELRRSPFSLQPLSLTIRKEELRQWLNFLEAMPSG